MNSTTDSTNLREVSEPYGNYGDMKPLIVIYFFKEGCDHTIFYWMDFLIIHHNSMYLIEQNKSYRIAKCNAT